MTHKELIKIREDKKLTKGQFAALLGISAMMQGRYEGGKIKIPDHIAEKALALAAAKVIEDVAAGKKEEPKKAAAKAVAKKVAKDTKKKVVKDAEKKVVKETVKAAAGAAAVKGAKKAATTKKKTAAKKKETVLYIESLMGGTITAQEILKRIPSGADEVYVKPGENKAYWVKGKKTGEIDLW